MFLFAFHWHLHYFSHCFNLPLHDVIWKIITAVLCEVFALACYSSFKLIWMHLHRAKAFGCFKLFCSLSFCHHSSRHLFDGYIWAFRWQTSFYGINAFLLAFLWFLLLFPRVFSLTHKVQHFLLIFFTLVSLATSHYLVYIYFTIFFTIDLFICGIPSFLCSVETIKKMFDVILWLGTTWLSLWKQTFHDSNAISIRLQRTMKHHLLAWGFSYTRC